mgnify:FL=1
MGANPIQGVRAIVRLASRNSGESPVRLAQPGQRVGSSQRGDACDRAVTGSAIGSQPTDGDDVQGRDAVRVVRAVTAIDPPRVPSTPRLPEAVPGMVDFARRRFRRGPETRSPNAAGLSYQLAAMEFAP